MTQLPVTRAEALREINNISAAVQDDPTAKAIWLGVLRLELIEKYQKELGLSKDAATTKADKFIAECQS